MQHWGRQVAALLWKDGLLYLKAWYLAVLVVLIPIPCLWFLRTVVPEDVPADPTPTLYDASYLEPRECLTQREYYRHCQLLLYYPNCMGYESDETDGWCKGITNKAIRYVKEFYDCMGTHLNVCDYTSQKPNIDNYTDCEIVGFRDQTVFDAFSRANTFRENQVLAAVGVKEEDFFYQLKNNGSDKDMPGATKPIRKPKLEMLVLYNNTDDHEHPENMYIPASVTSLLHAGLMDTLWDEFMSENDYRYDPDPNSPYAEVTKYNLKVGFFPTITHYDQIIDTISTGAPIILALSIAVNYITQAFFVVSEKAAGNRKMLYAIGLHSTAFFVSKLVISAITAFVDALVVTLGILAFGFEWGSTADMFVTFVTFFLFYLAAEAFIHLLLSLFNKLNGALITSVLVLFGFLIGEMMHVVQIPTLFSEDPSGGPGQYCSVHIKADLVQMLVWFPTNLAAPLAQIGDFSVSKLDSTSEQPITPPGFSFQDAFSAQGPDKPSSTVHWCFSVALHWLCAIFNAVLYAALAYYFDRVLPFAAGRSAGIFFCFRRCIPQRSSPRALRGPLEEWDEDVRKEADRVENIIEKNESANVGVLVSHLTKVYGLKKDFNTSTKLVVNNLCMGISSGTVFGLLGPNGAGKTTTIKMLTGQLSKTAGYYKFFGHDPNVEPGKVPIGICPQHDIVYNGLSCTDNIRLYLRIKGSDIEAELNANRKRRENALAAGVGQGTSNWARKLQQRLTMAEKADNDDKKQAEAGAPECPVNEAETVEKLADDSDSTDDMALLSKNIRKLRGSNEEDESDENNLTSSSDSGDPFRGKKSYAKKNNESKHLFSTKQATQKLSRKERSELEKKLAIEYLGSVNLAASHSLCPGELSGGMRRRLSIVLALSASPMVCFLDEPTTGLDPVSKRVVWEYIIREKQDKCIILTTHSMEEADILSDRIGIMARGSLRCIGSSAHLKRVYGMGFRLDIETQFNVELGINYVPRIKSELVDVYCPDAVLVGRTGGHLTLALSRDMPPASIEALVAHMEEASRPVEGGLPLVIDWALSHTTLEEVFLAIARYAEKQFNRKLAKRLRGDS